MTVIAITSARRPVKDVRQKALVAELRARIAELEAQLAGAPARKPAARKPTVKAAVSATERRSAEALKAFQKMRLPYRPAFVPDIDYLSPAAKAQFGYTGGRKEDKGTLALVLNAARWTSEATMEEAA